MTIRYLIDTDWAIDHLNQIDRVVNRLKELRPQGLALSIISLAELSEGVHYSRTPEQSQQLGIGYGTAWNYVQRVKQGLRRSGVGDASS